MAKISISMLALAVSIATMLQTSSAQTYGPITCYQCTSYSVLGFGTADANCADTFKGSSTSNTCTGSQCMKSWSSLGVQRGCMVSSTATNGCTSTSAGGVCYCTGNNCNSATGLHPGHVTGALLVAAALALTFIGRRLL